MNFYNDNLTRTDDRIIEIDDLDNWTEVTAEDVRAGMIMIGLPVENFDWYGE